MAFSLELVRHASDFGMTYTLPYRYTPEKTGHMPTFNQFLNDCWATDADYRGQVACAAGGHRRFAHGQGPAVPNGLPPSWSARCGKISSAVHYEGLLPVGSSSSMPPNDPLPPSRDVRQGDIFKKVVSGEELTVHHKNRDPFSLEPKAAHCFNSNHMLKTYDSSDGFKRRWLIFEFNNRVDP